MWNPDTEDEVLPGRLPKVAVKLPYEVEERICIMEEHIDGTLTEKPVEKRKVAISPELRKKLDDLYAKIDRDIAKEPKKRLGGT